MRIRRSSSSPPLGELRIALPPSRSSARRRRTAVGDGIVTAQTSVLIGAATGFAMQHEMLADVIGPLK